MKRQHMVVGTTLLGALGLSLLAGCGPKPDPPEVQKQKNAEALSKENASPTPPENTSPHGNISGENAAPPPK